MFPINRQLPNADFSHPFVIVLTTGGAPEDVWNAKRLLITRADKALNVNPDWEKINDDEIFHNTNKPGCSTSVLESMLRVV